MAPFEFAGWTEAQCRAYLVPQFNMRERGFRQQYPQADQHIIVFDGINVGRIIVNREPTEIHIIDIVISGDYRQHGIASCLLTQLCSEANQEQKKVKLHVAYDNPAANLYRRFGFKVISDKDIYICMERQPEQLTEITALKGKYND